MISKSRNSSCNRATAPPPPQRRVILEPPRPEFCDPPTTLPFNSAAVPVQFAMAKAARFSSPNSSPSAPHASVIPSVKSS